MAYFGSESDYQNCFTDGDEATFAGYAGDTGGSPFILKDMEVTVHVSAGESLTLGIRSGNMKSDGTVTTTGDGTGWFKVDNFRIELIEDDATSLNEELKVKKEGMRSEKYDAAYDLSGRRITESQFSLLTPQLVILNGRKRLLTQW